MDRYQILKMSDDHDQATQLTIQYIVYYKQTKMPGGVGFQIQFPCQMFCLHFIGLPKVSSINMNNYEKSVNTFTIWNNVFLTNKSINLFEEKGSTARKVKALSTWTIFLKKKKWKKLPKEMADNPLIDPQQIISYYCVLKVWINV